MLNRLFAGIALLVVTAGAASGQSLSDILPATGNAGILPMETIVAEVREAIEGTITEIELEHKRGAWVYEVEVVSQDGRKTELLLDARSGKILSQKMERR